MKTHTMMVSPPMVEALLAGRKTQTRRPIDPQPNIADWKYIQAMHGYAGGDLTKPFGDWYQWRVVGPDYPDCDDDDVWCPWAVGDLLSVRERFAIGAFIGGRCAGNSFVHFLDGAQRYMDSAQYSANNYAKGEWHPSRLHWNDASEMPEWASRLTLRVTAVRAQLLQEITEEDAIAEGIEPAEGGWKSYEVIHDGPYKGEAHPHAAVPNRSARTSFKELWEAIHGEGAWREETCVWALTFEVIHDNIEEVQRNGGQSISGASHARTA